MLAQGTPTTDLFIYRCKQNIKYSVNVIRLKGRNSYCLIITEQPLSLSFLRCFVMLETRCRVIIYLSETLSENFTYLTYTLKTSE